MTNVFRECGNAHPSEASLSFASPAAVHPSPGSVTLANFLEHKLGMPIGPSADQEAGGSILLVPTTLFGG